MADDTVDVAADNATQPVKVGVADGMADGGDSKMDIVVEDGGNTEQESNPLVAEGATGTITATDSTSKSTIEQTGEHTLEQTGESQPQEQRDNSGDVEMIQDVENGEMIRENDTKKDANTSASAVRIQSVARGYLARKRYRKMQSDNTHKLWNAALLIQKWARMWRKQTLFKQIQSLSSQQETWMIYFLLQERIRQEKVRNSSSEFYDGQSGTGQDVLSSDIRQEVIKQVSELRRMRRKRMQQLKSPLTQEEESYYKSIAAYRKSVEGYRRKGKPTGGLKLLSPDSDSDYYSCLVSSSSSDGSSHSDNRNPLELIRRDIPGMLNGFGYHSTDDIQSESEMDCNDPKDVESVSVPTKINQSRLAQHIQASIRAEKSSRNDGGAILKTPDTPDTNRAPAFQLQNLHQTNSENVPAQPSRPMLLAYHEGSHDSTHVQPRQLSPWQQPLGQVSSGQLLPGRLSPGQHRSPQLPLTTTTTSHVIIKHKDSPFTQVPATAKKSTNRFPFLKKTPKTAKTFGKLPLPVASDGSIDGSAEVAFSTDGSFDFKGLPKIPDIKQ